MALKLLVELYSVKKLTYEHTIAPKDDLLARFSLLIKQIGLTKSPQLLLSLNTQVPMAIGWLKPVVLIPFSMLSGLTPAQLDMLILHELAHIKRHDYLVNFIQTLVEIVLFFHPAVLWVSNQMRNEREYCTDDIAVHHCGNPIAYARTLTETASLCNKHKKQSIPEMAMAASGGDLTQRVLRLVNEPHCSSQSTNGKWFASLSVLGMVCLISVFQLIKLTDVDINASQYTFNNKVNSFEATDFDTTYTQQVIMDNANKDLITLSNKVQQTTTSSQIYNAINDKIYREDIKVEPTTTSTQTENNLVVLSSVSINKQKNNILLTQALNNSISNQPSIADTTKKNQIKRKIKDNALINSANLSDQPKSISDIAFEKTDSTLSSSLLNNPYAKEVAALSKDLNTTRVTKINTNNTQSNLSKINILERESAKLISSTAPKYPSTAKRKGIELEVKVDFVIGKDGSVKDITFHPKNKINYFRASVRSAIEKWQFEPAKFNGKVIDSKMSKIFSFSLER